MLDNRNPAVDVIAAEAKKLVDALFHDVGPRVYVDAEEAVLEELKAEQPKPEAQTVVFDLTKDGDENYDFMVTNRISPATMAGYLQVVEEVMSMCPELSEETARLIVNVYANHLDISEQLIAQNFGPQVGGLMTQASNSVSRDYMILTGKVLNSKDAFAQLVAEVSDEIKAMTEGPDLQEKIRALGLTMLSDPMKAFAFLMSKFSTMQLKHIERNFMHMAPQGYVASVFQLNRLAKITCEVLCILHEKSTK